MTQVNTLTVDDLVVQAKGNSEALGVLYERYYERLLRFCVLRLFNQEAAEEVMANVFLSVADSIGRFRGTTERQFGSWLYRIATNQCNNYVRKTKRRQRILEGVSYELAQRYQMEADETPESFDNWPAIYAAMSQLKPVEQTVITLRFFEKLEFETIAEITGKRLTTVRVILHRALKKLRQRLSYAVGGEL
ncbi:RNA polymerase sigma factor [Planctomycetota bacterium]